MKENYIESALNSQLNSLSLSTKWENKDFTPVKGTLWVRPTFSPTGSVAAAIGASAANRIFGIYNISIFAPNNEGVNAGGIQTETIMTAFKRDTALIYSGVTVKIIRVWRATGLPETDWYHIPVIVEWRADVDV